MNDLWTSLAARAGLTLTDAQDAQLSRYLDLVIAANARMNLTRIADRPSADVQHVGDALTLLPHLPHGPAKLADVGSGPGVPGIPLAIVRPDFTVVLIEATQKKAAFLRETAAALGLANVTVWSDRAEAVGLSEDRASFDVAVARAVATLDWLAEWLLPLVRVGGSMLAMKGQRVTDELPAAAWAIRQLGGGPPVVHAVDLPGSEHRVIVQIAKVRPTDARFPRPPTAAKGKPLSEGPKGRA
jgi:16S rRNA (guanine527-N7)-methyltransferase